MSEPLNATFFTLHRRDRAVLLPATLVMLAAQALLVAAFVALNWGFFSQVGALLGTAADGGELSSDQGAVLGLGVITLVFSVFIFLFPFYFVLAAYEAACLRWMIRGEAPGLFGITFDFDMWRVYGVYWCWFILQMVVSMVVSMLTMPLVFMTMGDLVNAGGAVDEAAMWRWQLTVQLPITLLQYIPLIFFGVRFGPAAVTSIARKRFAFLDAWKVTSERFWALFGSFALIALIVAAVWITQSVISFYVDYRGSWEEFSAVWRPLPPAASPEEVQELYTELWRQLVSRQGIISLAASTVVGLATWIWWALMTYGINARVALVALEEGKISVHSDAD